MEIPEKKHVSSVNSDERRWPPPKEYKMYTFRVMVQKRCGNKKFKTEGKPPKTGVGC